jgi:acetylornithine deacetylase/succinyl-diaminopimelate desuccinylase-like protein
LRPTEPTQALAFARRNRPRFLAELREFVRIPSVSSQPRHAADVRRCAEWLGRELRRIGLRDVAIIKTPRHPALVARSRVGPGRPTVLIYGHYDVQPAEPERWRSPPFEPMVRGEHLYGRGAADDKGQLFAHIKAVEAYRSTAGGPPVNVAFLVEGEEEVGSPNLRAVLEAERVRLAPDVAAISDTRMLGPLRPAITYSLRGSLGLDLELRGPKSELHSGNFGGAVRNPIQTLCEVIAGLHDRDGRIAVPGLYDSVRKVDAVERAYMRRNGPTDAAIARDAGVRRLWGEPGFTAHERATIRPALIVNGIVGGYQGPGGKSIIPARADAKLQFRLVPDQDPAEVEELFRARIARLLQPGVKPTLRSSVGVPPVVLPRQHPAMAAAASAYERGFGARPAFVRSGGTIPAVSLLRDVFGVHPVMMGFALPTSRIHAPNERLHLPTFYRAVETCIWFIAELASSFTVDSSAIPRATRDSAARVPLDR